MGITRYRYPKYGPERTDELVVSIRALRKALEFRVTTTGDFLLPGELHIHQHPGIRIDLHRGRLLVRRDFESLLSGVQLEFFDLELCGARRRHTHLQRQTKRLARLRLRQVNLNLPGGGVVLPATLDGRRAGAIHPLLEEPAEILAGDFLHHLAQVLGGGVGVAVAPVVFANAGPEGIRAYLAAKHVQRPRALLVNDGVGNAFPRLVLHYGDSGHTLFVAENAGAALFQAGHEGVAPLIMFGG